MMDKIRDRLKRSPTCAATGENHDIDRTVNDDGNVLNTICRSCGIRNPQGS